MDPMVKFRAAWRLAGALPDQQRRRARSALVKIDTERKKRAQSVGEEGGEAEWDLELANKLDSVYQAVSSEVKNVATGVNDAVNAAARTTGNVISSVATPLSIPLALGVAVGLYLLVSKKR